MVLGCVGGCNDREKLLRPQQAFPLLSSQSRTEHRGHAAPFTFTVDLRVRGSCAVGMLGVLRRLATVSSGNEKAAMVKS
ncbi:hypothetical protein SRHO_G00263310 [Serrasalmus rhombeus]